MSTHIHSHTHSYTHTHTHTHTLTHTFTHTHIHIHTLTHTQRDSLTHTLSHTHTLTHTDTLTHPHRHTHTHTHTQPPFSSVPRNFSSRHGSRLNPQKAQPSTGLVGIYPREPRTDLRTDTLQGVYSSLTHNLQKLAHKRRDEEIQACLQMDSAQGWEGTSY